jgi:hypothetical protein
VSDDKFVYIIRFEESDGTGAYANAVRKVVDQHSISPYECGYGNECPHPIDDEWPQEFKAMGRIAHIFYLAKFLKIDQTEMFFGFSSPTQVRNWFKDEHRSLIAQAGAPPVMYKVPKESVLVGRCQAVFDKTKATKIGQLDPFTLELA